GNTNTAMNSALDDYRRQFTGRGQPVPAEGEAMIREHFGTQAQQMRANFAEQARANRQQAAQYLTQYLTGLGQQGMGTASSAAGAVEGLGNNYAGLAGGLKNASAQQGAGAFGGLNSLIGFGMNLLGRSLFRPPNTNTTPTPQQAPQETPSTGLPQNP